jgi:glycosyltransferase involved in cell wall biosynthesis
MKKVSPVMIDESKPLRLLMVAPRYSTHPRGGGMMLLYQIGRRLARAGVEVTVLATDEGGRLSAAEESEGMHILRVRAWPANKDYYFAPAIYRIITRGQWDIIHVLGYHNLIPPLAMLAARRAHIPYVLSFFSGGDRSRLRKTLRGMHHWMLRPLFSRARKLIALSQFEADFFRKRLRLPPEQFMVISSGADHLPDVPEMLEGATNEPDDGHLILSIGRLVRYKGHHRVIEALPKVLEQIPDARLRIAGVGAYESTLRNMAENLGVADRVEIRPFPPGDWNGTASLIASASLVTLLSEYESQGIAILEALAFRRPILVTGASALQEYVDRGLARAVPLKSRPEEVAGAVVDQLRHPLIPVKAELPTWDDGVDDLIALYHSIAERPARKELSLT